MKSCKESGATYTFDKNGIQTTLTTGEELYRIPSSSYKLDANGRLTRYFPSPDLGNLFEKYDYDKFGRVTKVSVIWEGDLNEATTYVYNTKGEQIEKRCVAYGPHGGEGVYTYKVLEKDQYGNWTKRETTFNNMGNPNIETREITYYE